MTFPAALDLRGKRCLVVGSGEEALRRVTQFHDVGADVHWVTRGANETFPDVTISVREFHAEDLEGAWLVVLGDQDATLADELGSLCKTRRVFFCAIDQPKQNTFSHMARIDAPPVIIAISTGGLVPGLAGRLKQILGGLFPPPVIEYFAHLTELRRSLPDPQIRKRTVKAAVAALELRGELHVPTRKSDTSDGTAD